MPDQHETTADTHSLSLGTLVEIVGLEAFEAACRSALASGSALVGSDVPHTLSDRLWYEGDDSLQQRLVVAAELYQRMPCYGNLMYWRHPRFDEPALAHLWDAYRGFLGDPRDAVADPAAYSLWVDWFEDRETVERAWREVAGPQEPRRPRLERVLGASGPVPWSMKVLLYERLAREGGWDEPLVAGLWGSCIDLYGSLDQQAALSLARRLQPSSTTHVYPTLIRALQDPRLPKKGPDRRSYVANLMKDG